MGTFLGRWLEIYQDEIGLFLWSAVIYFLIRSSNIILNNFVETVFLKRFGVEYLPVVYIIISISAFLPLSLMAGLIARCSRSRLLLRMLLFCGGGGCPSLRHSPGH